MSNPQMKIDASRVSDSYDMWPYGGNYEHPLPFHGYLNNGYFPDLYSYNSQYPYYSPQPYPLNYNVPQIQNNYAVQYGPRQFYPEQPRTVFEKNPTLNYNGNTNFKIGKQNPKLNIKSCEQGKPFGSNVEKRNEVPLQKNYRNHVDVDKNRSSTPIILRPCEENIQKSEMGTRKWKSPSNDKISGVVEDKFNIKSIPMKQMEEPHEVLKVEKKSVSDEEAAVIIQCTYRGYMVRKWELLKKLRQIVKIREHVDDVAKSIQALQSSSDDLKDGKQRLIIEETIMSLLLKLDTIQGLPPSYREVRKSVVRDLTKLEEMLDGLTVNAIPVEQFEDEAVASPVLSKNSGDFNRKLLEENAMLKEQMGKLIEEGKEKTTLISNLSKRLEILEQTTRQLCGRVFPL